MTAVHRDYIRTIRTSDFTAWIAFSEADQRWYVEVFARTTRGVHYLEVEHSGDQPTEQQLMRAAFHYGYFSPRPCRLDTRFDPSMMHAALALLRHWCNTRSVDFDALLKTAYEREPERLDESVPSIVAQAEWEGVEYPKAWDRFDSRHLLLALRDVGYDKIAAAFVPLVRQHG